MLYGDMLGGYLSLIMFKKERNCNVLVYPCVINDRNMI